MKKISFKTQSMALLSSVFILSVNSAIAQNRPSTGAQVEVAAGTKIPVVLMNFVSGRNARVGDQLYLQTIYPVTVSNRVIIPPGTHVRGSIVELKRPGRIRGKGEMLIQFEEMILPNGVTRSLVGAVAGADGRFGDQTRDDQGRIVGGGSAGRDAAAVAVVGSTGAAIGALAGRRSGRAGTGAAIGAGVGVSVALVTVLLSRGPDVWLPRGTIMDMVLMNPLTFTADEVRFSEAQLSRNPLKDIPESGPRPVIWRRQSYPYPYPYPYPFPYWPAVPH